MITMPAFLTAVKENAARVTHYESGGDGKGGGCDCIGLIIGAVKLAGGSWTGVHGSNWAARNAIRDLHSITKSEQLEQGDIVFKAKSPGENGYAMPSRYKASGDLMDYYHVGVVTKADPLCITHCTSVAGGIKRDTSIGAWAYAGELKCVDYGGDPVLYQAIVSSKNGKPVNLRKTATTNAKVIEQVPVGALVDVLEETSEKWAHVSDHGVAGYMMREFLARAGEGTEAEETSLDHVSVSRDDLAAKRRALEELIAWINQLLEG